MLLFDDLCWFNIPYFSWACRICMVPSPQSLTVGPLQWMTGVERFSWTPIHTKPGYGFFPCPPGEIHTYCLWMTFVTPTGSRCWFKASTCWRRFALSASFCCFWACVNGVPSVRILVSFSIFLFNFAACLLRSITLYVIVKQKVKIGPMC